MSENKSPTGAEHQKDDCSSVKKFQDSGFLQGWSEFNNFGVRAQRRPCEQSSGVKFFCEQQKNGTECKDCELQIIQDSDENLDIVGWVKLIKRSLLLVIERLAYPRGQGLAIQAILRQS